MRRAVVVSLLVAAGSLLVVAPAPSYDPWAWLAWGDQVLAGRLSTLEGPSFKPLPVAVCALLAPLGAAAPVLWVLLARAGASLAVVLAFRAGHRLAGDSRVGGALAATGVVLCGDYLGLAAAGWSEGILLALGLAGAEAWRAGRPRWALACGVAAALVRVETWPFLLAAGVLFWRRRPDDRRLLVTTAILVPVAWIVPELVGSGQALRSAARARVPNPGQPGLSEAAAWASLGAALALPLWPLWAGVALAAWPAWLRRDGAARALLAPAAMGLAWIGLVAAMAEAGFSGEPRYALPGAALVAVSGAAGLVVAARRLVPGRGAGVTGRGAGVTGRPRAARSTSASPDRAHRSSRYGSTRSGPSRSDRYGPSGLRLGLAAVAVALVVGSALPRVVDIGVLHRTQADQAQLQADLVTAVALAGGPDAVLACGAPFVGPLRGPLLAYHLGVARHRVEPDRAPEAPGVVFRSALHRGDPPAPVVPAAFHPLARAGRWQVAADCERPVDPGSRPAGPPVDGSLVTGSPASGPGGAHPGAGAPGGRPPR